MNNKCAECKLGIGKLNKYKHNDKCNALYHKECVTKLCRECGKKFIEQRQTKIEFRVEKMSFSNHKIWFLLNITYVLLCILYYEPFSINKTSKYNFQFSGAYIGMLLYINLSIIMSLLIYLVPNEMLYIQNWIGHKYMIILTIFSKFIITIVYHILPKTIMGESELIHFILFSGVIMTYETLLFILASILLIIYGLLYCFYDYIKSIFFREITTYEFIEISDV
jgi:hypothetical protein